MIRSTNTTRRSAILCAFGSLMAIEGVQAAPAQRSGAAKAKAKQPTVPQRVSGRYRLDQRAIECRIPNDVIVYGGACDAQGACGQIQGFNGSLAWDGDATVYLNSEGIAQPSPLDEVVRTVLARVRAHAAFTTVSDTKQIVDGLEGRRLCLRVGEKGRTANRMLDVVVVVRSDVKDIGPVWYEFGLETSATTYRTNRRVLDSILAATKFL